MTDDNFAPLDDEIGGAAFHPLRLIQSCRALFEATKQGFQCGSVGVFGCGPCLVDGLHL